jgi:hypothetical protein
MVFHFAERHVLFIVMLNVIMLNVVIMKVVMLNVVILRVVAPQARQEPILLRSSIRALTLISLVCK